MIFRVNNTQQTQTKISIHVECFTLVIIHAQNHYPEWYYAGRHETQYNETQHKGLMCDA
jgi:hypothetical protein